jgi:hypothetical protein
MQHADKIQENEYHSEKRAVEKPKTVLSACKRGLLLKTRNLLSSAVDFFSRLYIKFCRIMHHITCYTTQYPSIIYFITPNVLEPEPRQVLDLVGTILFKT